MYAGNRTSKDFFFIVYTHDGLDGKTAKKTSGEVFDAHTLCDRRSRRFENSFI